MQSNVQMTMMKSFYGVEKMTGIKQLQQNADAPVGKRYTIILWKFKADQFLWKNHEQPHGGDQFEQGFEGGCLKKGTFPRLEEECR